MVPYPNLEELSIVAIIVNNEPEELNKVIDKMRC